MMVMIKEGETILSVHQEYMLQSRLLGQEMTRRKQGTLQTQQSESRILIEDKEIDGISMESRHLLLPQRHTSRVSMYIVGRLGDHMSLPIVTNGQLNPIDFKRPTEVMANGPDGLVTSESQPDHWSGSSKWQSSAGDDSSWKKVPDWEVSQWSAPTRRTLKGSEYESDRDWQLQNMRYGEGWACDSTQSHSKRAKPTYTDPEDDRMTDSSLPIGSTSKTYDPEKDSFWQRGDRGQNWSYSSSSSGQWRPRLWRERDISSAAGDTVWYESWVAGCRVKNRRFSPSAWTKPLFPKSWKAAIFERV